MDFDTVAWSDLIQSTNAILAPSLAIEHEHFHNLHGWVLFARWPLKTDCIVLTYHVQVVHVKRWRKKRARIFDFLKVVAPLSSGPGSIP